MADNGVVKTETGFWDSIRITQLVDDRIFFIYMFIYEPRLVIMRKPSPNPGHPDKYDLPQWITMA